MKTLHEHLSRTALASERIATVLVGASATPMSPWIWIAAPLTLGLAVMIAAVLPARRALASDPLLIMKDHQ